MQVIESRFGEDIEDLIRRLYSVEGRRQDEVAAKLGIDQGTLRRWMERLGIPARRKGPRPAGTVMA